MATMRLLVLLFVMCAISGFQITALARYLTRLPQDRIGSGLCLATIGLAGSAIMILAWRLAEE